MTPALDDDSPTERFQKLRFLGKSLPPIPPDHFSQELVVPDSTVRLRPVRAEIPPPAPREFGLLGWSCIVVASSAALAVAVQVICWAVRS